MADMQHAADIAELQAKVTHVEAAVLKIEAAASERSRAQSESTRMILERIEEVRGALNLQQGFLNGALFTVKAFWLVVGGLAVAVAAKIFDITK